MKVIVFSSPGREQMLQNLLLEIEGEDYTIIDEPETFGKKNFWKRYKQAFDICRESEHDWFLFLHDDEQHIDFQALEKFKQMFADEKIVLNLTSDVRTECWGNIYHPTPDIMLDGYTLKNQGFYDCSGLIHRNTLKGIDMEEVKDSWFNRPDKSSGVGYQLTAKFRQKGIPMYRPFPSMAYSGDHPSVMHPEERLKNPLICQK
jgi:hypothetical protein